MAKSTILDLQPGYLNDFNVDDVDQESIDFQSESPQSIFQRIKNKVFNPNKFKTSGTLIGILLRSNDEYSADCTAQDGAIQIAKPGSQKYKLNTYKVRIPELHFMLPVPDNLFAKQLSKADKLIIDAYPTIQAVDTLVQTQGARVGDLVKVELANKGAISRMYFAGPLDPKNVGINAAQLKACIDACKKIYSGPGSTGDCIGKNTNLATLDTATPISEGEGHTDDDIIDESGAAWLKKILESNKTSFPGRKYIGRIDGNGPDDDVEMKDGQGRTTFIFMPKGVDPKQKLELIYFFHDNNKFSTSDASEWTQIGATVTNMVKINKEKFSGGRRNVIFIMPEMLWSAQKMSSPGIGFARIQSAKSAFKGGQFSRYKDRHHAVWGFGGKTHWAPKNKLFSKGYEGYKPAGAGDITKFIKTVNEKLKTHFNVDASKVEQVTLVGDGYGAAAISNLGRMGKLSSEFKKLKKIQLLHADYSGHEDNHYSDNDIVDILSSIDPNKVEIEVHLSAKGTDPKSELPRKAFGAFLGRTSQLTQQWANSGDLDDKELLMNAQDARKVLIKGYKDGLNFGTATKSPNKNAYEAGENFLQSNKTNVMRLSGPWANIIFRGVDSKPNIDWITWLADDTSVPSAVSSSEVIKNKSQVIVAGSDISKSDIDDFSKFKGKTFLYNSAAGENGGPQLKGKTAIVVPTGADLSKPYELIFYFHGIGKTVLPNNWKNDGFHKKIQDALNNMVTIQKRNVVYVTTQLNTYSKMNYKKATFGLESAASFPAFVTNVIDTIKLKDNNQGLGAAAGPKFINIKSFSGGFYVVKAIMLKGAPVTAFGGVPLQRIDYFDSTYTYKDVFEKIFVDSKSSFKPGKDFEMHVYGGKDTWNNVSKFKSSVSCPNSGFNGCKELKDNGKELKLSKLEGLYLENVGGHAAVRNKKFDAKSLLPAEKANATPNFSPIKATDVATTIKPADIPVAYDKDGHAYNFKGDKLPESFDLEAPNVKCAKGDLKKQTAKTTKPIAQKGCERKCRTELSAGRTGKHSSIPKGVVDCGPNPLGLIDYGPTTDFNKGLKIAAIMRASRKYYWGQGIVGEFIKKVLEDPLWTHMDSGKYIDKQGKKQVQWVIRDISPKWANGIDMVKGHGSHREGIGFDLSLPIDYKRSKPSAKFHFGLQTLYESPEKDKGRGVLNYDKTIALALLTMAQPGMEKSVMFLGVDDDQGSRFGPYITKRCDELISGKYDENFIGAPHSALTKLFTGFNGKTKKKVTKFFVMYKSHQHHYHVRLGRRLGSHQLNWPKFAQKRLKKNKCEYTGPNPNSPLDWQAQVDSGDGTVNLSKSAVPAT